ncbi:MFS general substrate transporter [Penicillium herquei]|nr:MFS general substrate transporter [Penicillium herquei]
MLFSYAEKRIATVPMVPSRLIKNRNVAIAFVCTLPMKFVFDQLRFSFGTYLEARALGKESSFGDWALSAVYLGRLFGTIGGGILIRRYRKFKKFLQLNILVDFIIYLCLASGFMHLEQPVFAPVLVFIGATEGFAESLWLVAVLSLVDSDDQPLLYAFFGLSLAVAGDLGIAISLAAEGNLVRMKLNDQLHNYPNAAEIIRRSLEDLNYVRQLPDDLQVMVINALLSSIEIAFGASCIMLVISLISSFWMKEMSSLSRGYSYVS